MVLSVSEFVDTIDNTLVLELYGIGQASSMDHLGTFHLDHEDSRSDLLEQYGGSLVKAKDVYKAYVLVYIDL